MEPEASEFPKGLVTRNLARIVAKTAQLLPSRSRRISDKLWSVGKGHVENKSSETSKSSHSPISNVPEDSKSISRHRRHSIS
ncbi:hypothetical protein DVH24_040070 [Malus domestica]|uniref:Uncharacterized protein n=1 Tax=Malus domestica TaxID=3750 RepID=A0A498I5B8_MALDO|nr:hypothetical protein DVH24_040070 [Malus domestica]